LAESFVILDQVIIVLVCGIIAAKLSERINLPSVIPLVIIGYLVGPEVLDIFVPLNFGVSLSALVTLIIPIVLFDEGMRIDPRILNDFKMTIFLLATVAVVVSTVGVGLITYIGFGMPLTHAFLLGAILAATSPAAAITAMKQFNIEKKISTIIEAEASFNDATAIVLFTIISGTILGTTISFLGAISSFTILFFGGLLVGSLLSLLLVFLVRKFSLQEYAVYVSLIGFLGAYATAEVAGASGATAVVASGLVLAWGFKKTFGLKLQDKLDDAWSNLSFIARSIIFLVLGASFSVHVFSSIWVQALILVVFLFAVVRPISVYFATSLETRLSGKEKLFISWIGSRGEVPAALSLSAIGLGITGAEKIFDIVIVVVLASLIIVGVSGRKIAKLTLRARTISLDALVKS